MENTLYHNKRFSYYGSEKSRIHPHISQGPNVILDMGCGTGQLGRKLIESDKAKELVGVDIYKPAIDEAAKYYHRIHHGDIELLDLKYKKYFDYVICGDVIEHLRDPWSMMEKIYGWLKDEGHIVVTIPNIRYWPVLKGLIFSGKWEYVEAGVLDKTHLRFFTKKTFFTMLENANYKINHYEMIIYGRKKNIINKMTFGLFKEFLGGQILVSAHKLLK